jgi:Uma2 family endonuclease
MAMVQTPVQPIRLSDFLKLPETKPASEFIDGHLLQKPMPQGKHSTFQCDLVPAINISLPIGVWPRLKRGEIGCPCPPLPNPLN